MTTATMQVIATIKAEPRFGPDGMSLWRLTRLSPGKTPAWFRRIVDRDFDGSFNADWFDHHAKDGERLVVEPYDVSHEELRDILAFADKYALNVSISAITFHFPTRTVAITFIPRGHQ
jgi:hypothetical protein